MKLSPSTKRENRWKRKMMKTQAELCLIKSKRMEEIVTENFNAPTSTPVEETDDVVEENAKNVCKTIQKEVRERRRGDNMPRLNLTLHRLPSPRRSGMQGICESSGQVTTFDIQSMLLYATVGPQYSYKPRWVRMKPWKASQVILISANVSKQTFLRHSTCFPYLRNNFHRQVDVEQCDFVKEVSVVPLHVNEIINRQSQPEIEASTSNAVDLSRPSTKLNLLMTPIEMIEHQYPLPSGRLPGFLYSKDSYSTVSESSPVFAVDCEMCMTDEEGHELTRISVVDEAMNVIYDTLVKPDHTIVDYLTKYSGITKGMLSGVTTTLEQVQHALKQVLPPDAILCGHSLNFDLRALKMFHPYVIDLSCAFNLSGDKNLKSSLQTLAYTFLGEEIQCSSQGHCSIEDALTTMKLFKLKLEKQYSFGNVMLGWQYHNYATTLLRSNSETKTVGQKRSHEEEPDISGSEPEPKRRKMDENLGKNEEKTKNFCCFSCKNEIKLNCRANSCICRNLHHHSCAICCHEILKKEKYSDGEKNSNSAPKISMADAFRIQALDRTENLFPFLLRHKKSTIFVSGPCEENFGEFCQNFQFGSRHFHLDSNFDRTAKIKERLLEFDLAWVDFSINDRNSCAELSDLDEKVNEIFKSAAAKSLICVLFNSRSSTGICCIKIKGS